jgi:hypothetical protein
MVKKRFVKTVVGSDHAILLLCRNLPTQAGRNHEIFPAGIIGASANTEIVHLLSTGRKQIHLVPAHWFYRYE